MLAAAFAAAFVVSWLGLGTAPLPTGLLLLTLLAAVLAVVDVAVHRPLRRIMHRATARLGEAYRRGDPGYRDEVRELAHLVGTLVAVFTASEDKEWVSQSIKDDLARAQSLNRQLVEVGDAGKAMNAALPYRETVDLVLTQTRALLHADFTALLLLDSEARSFRLEGTQGVRGDSFDPDCCAYTPDCPVRASIYHGSIERRQGHECGLVPHTMGSELAVSLAVENVGEMALLVAATDDRYLALFGDEALGALQGHLQSALTNAHKYDAIRRQVVTDHLTGLYNRRYFTKRADEEVQRALRHQTPLSLLMADVDHFKLVNDTYGHATGDRVLQTVAGTIRDLLRSTDVCARYGGEEFAVLLPHTPGENAFHVAERIRETLGQTRYTGLGLPPDASVTISLGVATCPGDATSLDELLELADKALYRAKDAGRDAVRTYAGPPARARTR
jgi:diguanylate cyclase (GGDEF)-like protein